MEYVISGVSVPRELHRITTRNDEMWIRIDGKGRSREYFFFFVFYTVGHITGNMGLYSFTAFFAVFFLLCVIIGTWTTVRLICVIIKPL